MLKKKKQTSKQDACSRSAMHAHWAHVVYYYYLRMRISTSRRSLWLTYSCQPQSVPSSADEWKTQIRVLGNYEWGFFSGYFKHMKDVSGPDMKTNVYTSDRLSWEVNILGYLRTRLKTKKCSKELSTTPDSVLAYLPAALLIIRSCGLLRWVFPVYTALWAEGGARHHQSYTVIYRLESRPSTFSIVCLIWWGGLN